MTFSGGLCLQGYRLSIIQPVRHCIHKNNQSSNTGFTQNNLANFSTGESIVVK